MTRPFHRALLMLSASSSLPYASTHPGFFDDSRIDESKSHKVRRADWDVGAVKEVSEILISVRNSTIFIHMHTLNLSVRVLKLPPEVGPEILCPHSWLRALYAISSYLLCYRKIQPIREDRYHWLVQSNV